MKLLAAILISCALYAQAPAVLSTKDADALTTRMLQLMESTAVATPGLVKATEPIQQSAQKTFTAMRLTPQQPSLMLQFINHVKAYLAISEALPRTAPLPAVAEKQYSELRDSMQRMQKQFEALLDTRTQAAAARATDPYNLKRYQDANGKMPPLGKIPRVVFMGDSITDFWRLNEYFGQRDFVNRGISGQRTDQMVQRFKQDVLDLKPKAVVILAGTNDIAREVPVKVIEDNIAMMADLAVANHIEVVIASILPVSDYHKDVKPSYEMTKTRPPDTILEVNRWIKTYCDRHKLTYLDYFTAMVDKEGQLKEDLADDGLHPNAKGYRIMSPLAQEAIGRALTLQTPVEEPQTGRKRTIK